MAQHPIRGLVRTVRHVLGRQVRQPGQDLVDFRAQPGRFRGGWPRRFLVLGHTGAERLDVLAALLGGADLPGDAVAPGLGFLRAGLGGAPRVVEREDLLGARR